MRNKNNQNMLECLFIMAGTTLLAIAINVFFEPFGVVTGGVSGLSIIIKNLAENKFGVSIPLWITNIALNIPLFIVGIKVLGFKFLSRTIFTTFYLSFALFYTKFIPTDFLNDTELILVSLFGGVLSGVGLGLVFSSFATTGGTDLAATIIHKYFKHISVSKLLLALDSTIIVLGVFMFGFVKAMYAIIAVYITSKVIDNVLEGLSFSKAAFIISEYSSEIAQKVLTQVNRGVTGLTGRGMYTLKSKEVLLCVVSRKQIVQLKEIVKAIDNKAFLLVFDVRETLGEGFQSNV